MDVHVGLTLVHFSAQRYTLFVRDQGGSLVPPYTHGSDSLFLAVWGLLSSTFRLKATLISWSNPGDVSLSVIKAAQADECTSLYSGPTFPDVDDMLMKRPQRQRAYGQLPSAFFLLRDYEYAYDT